EQKISIGSLAHNKPANQSGWPRSSRTSLEVADFQVQSIVHIVLVLLAEEEASAQMVTNINYVHNDAPVAHIVRHPSSPLWHKALDRYKDELESIEEFQSIQDIQSLRDLINSVETLQTVAPRNHIGLVPLNRLAPRLKFIDDFSAVLALCFGADAALTAAVWGSIRLILGHASSAAETFQDVLDMLEELSLTLPRFQMYENTLPLNQSLQAALVDVYSEVICFYARTVHFLRDHPHLVLRKTEWAAFRKDYTRTILRIKRISSTVEAQADLARMRKDEAKYKEVLELMTGLNVGERAQEKSTSYNNIPFLMNNKFCGRDEILSTVHNELGCQTSGSRLRSMALFGMGGVGKSQIAMQYAYHAMTQYDVILWVAADNSIAMGQSFRNIADGIHLWDDGEETKDATAAIWKVKNWLKSTGSTWLLIFDNADDLATLKTAWPGPDEGSVLLTTRDFAVATSITPQYIHVQPLEDAEGSGLLLRAAGMKRDQTASSDLDLASTISRTLGGLPLALAQIGGFINQRKLSLADFSRLYEKNPARIESRKTHDGDYEYTMSTVWDVSFEKLTGDATSLLNILAFFDPDNISESILLQGSDGTDGDASEELLRGALVNRAAEASVLYLYEREMYTIAREFVEQAIESFEDKTTPSFASAIDLGGLNDIDLSQHARSLAPFNRALEIRQKHFGPEDPFIAFSLNNIALAYTEMGELEKAHRTHQEAIRLRLQANSDRIGNSYSNMSSLLLRMGKPDEAEEMLARCPSLKDFTDETFLATGNPRFSGDMVLLSRIRKAQGQTTEALRLASKALAFRQKLLGNRLKTCDSMYDVASMLLTTGHDSSARQLLEELVSISETFIEGEGQRARALCKLSGIYEKKGMVKESNDSRALALEIRQKLRPEFKNNLFQESEFAKLCVWMLW
ncbi:hypothetical protein CFIO01_04730, partial [Colletotrichum fioriniae PJ7]